MSDTPQIFQSRVKVRVAEHYLDFPFFNLHPVERGSRQVADGMKSERLDLRRLAETPHEMLAVGEGLTQELFAIGEIVQTNENIRAFLKLSMFIVANITVVIIRLI